MGRFVLRRTFGAIGTFVASTVVVFLVTFALPGDPARTIAGRRQPPEAVLRAIRHRFHLDQPLVSQYVHWLAGMLRGDFGESFVNRRPVISILGDALPVTATLLVMALVIEVALGLFVGSFVAARSGGALDRLVLAGCVLAIAVPPFVVASIAQDVLGVRWGLVPVAGTGGGVRSYVLPSCVLSLTGLAVAIRLARTETLAGLRAPHVATAHAKGLRSGVVMRRHVVRNGLVPFIGFVGLEIGALAGGSIVVERIFNLPGVGGAVATALTQHDNALILGMTMVIVAVYLVVDLLVDVVVALLDPRLAVVSK